MNRLFTQKSNLNETESSVGMLFLLAVLLLFAVTPCLAQSDDSEINTGPIGLPSASEADTVRSNVWLTEALMAEIAASTARVLPPAPAALQLVQEAGTMEDGMFKTALVRVLGGLGYDMYLQDEDPAMQAAVDCIYTFQVNGVELSYPDVGRTLGLWRRWIDREMKVTVRVDITMANSGRVLLSDLVQRRFSDRVSDDQFDMVDSDLYEFTTAETSESGWKSRMEEIIVLGTLAGLVAVYFSNTGD